MLRCIACKRPLTKAAATLTLGNQVGHYGPKCAADAKLPTRLPSVGGPKRPRKPRRAKPDETQLALDLGVNP